jgi:hypothetical protein
MRSSGLLGMYRFGHGDARFVVAHLLVECPRPVVVAEHVQLYIPCAELSGPVLDELQRAGGVAFAPEVLVNDDVVDPD